MAIQSTLALSPVSPAVYSAIRRAHRPPRRLWLSALRLILQYLLTVPAVIIATPYVVLRNIFAFMRKHPAWTFKTAVSTTLVRIAINCMGIIRFAPAPHADSAATGFLLHLIQILGWRSYGCRIWADTKTVPHLCHLHGRRLDRVFVSPPPADWLRGLLAVRDPDVPLDEQISFSPMYYGRPMIDAGFAKRRVKCFWYLPRGKTVPSLPDDGIKERTKPVLLYCHGGAGVSFSAGDTFMGATLAGVLARNADIDVFTVDYDLAPYAKYPTTVVQLFSAWLYLVLDLGYHPSQIFFGGDSYGGMSVLLLNRYLRDVWPHLEAPTPESFLSIDPSLSDTEVAAKVEQFARILEGKPARPPPATPGIVLFSPWLHLDDMGVLFPSRAKAVGHDIVTLRYMTWGTDCLEMTHKHIATNALPVTSPWISPHYMPAEELAALPPIWVGNGGAEALVDEGTDLVRRARAAGTDAEHYIQPGMPHDFYTIPFEIGNAREHYILLRPWFVNHYESAQAKRQYAEQDGTQDAPTPREGPAGSKQEAPAEAVPVQAPSSDSRDTLAESKDTLAGSGVMVELEPKSTSPAPPVDQKLPKEKEEEKEEKEKVEEEKVEKEKEVEKVEKVEEKVEKVEEKVEKVEEKVEAVPSQFQHAHPDPNPQYSAPASIATTDDAAFESALEPDTPRALSPRPTHVLPAEEPELAEPNLAGPEPSQPAAEHSHSTQPATTPVVPKPEEQVEPKAEPKTEPKAEPKTEPKTTEAETSAPGAATKESVPGSKPAKETSKRTTKSKGKNSKRKGKR